MDVSNKNDYFVISQPLDGIVMDEVPKDYLVLHKTKYPSKIRAQKKLC